MKQREIISSCSLGPWIPWAFFGEFSTTPPPCPFVSHFTNGFFLLYLKFVLTSSETHKQSKSLLSLIFKRFVLVINMKVKKKCTQILIINRTKSFSPSSNLIRVNSCIPYSFQIPQSRLKAIIHWNNE